MLDKTITIHRVEERHRFNQFQGAEKLTVYVFTVGPHGPFTEEFGAGQLGVEKIHERLNAHALRLRDTGALRE